MALEPQATFASAPKSDEKGIEVEDEVIPEWKPKKQEWAIMLTLSLLSLLVALDATVLVTGLPVLAEALNGTTVEAFWAGASYLLSSAVFQPVIASISAQFGRQQLLLISLTFFTVGTVFCAVAHNFTILLAGRSIQGIGGGGIVTMSQVIFCDIVPLRVRPKYFAIVLGAWAIGSIIGPVIGGVIIEHTTWRWLFYINFPFCALGFIFVPLCIKLTAVTKLTFSEKLRKIDWIGAFIFVGSMTSFLMGLSWAGVQYEWKSFQTLVPISVGVGGLFVFVAWEYFVGENSLLPLSLFYCWSAAAAFYCALINGLLLFTALYYFPFYLMSVKASMPTHAGVELFPALACLVPGSIIVSLLTTRLGRYRWAIWIGWSITTGGAGMLIPFFKLDTNMTVFAGVLAVFGVGTGMVLTSVNFAIQSISRPEDSAMAASVYGFFRSLGMPIGVAVGGTVFTNGMSSKLTDLHLPTIIAHQAEGYVQKLHTMADTDPLKIGVLEAYAHGFRGIWYFMACAAGSALLVSFIIQSFSMDKLFKSSFTTRPDSDTFSLVGTVKEKGDDFA
ncbi:MFS general substrate transporter [Microthyrium microscopicum]|uniref:MFS general substrate transporter n=1 Tax=Microthyrium microscopicum TaxID=703497 RepID=A0A6A6UVP8_9PEZI|nr:MFS general substrate transporter [Microthyrium microscopicum]